MVLQEYYKALKIRIINKINVILYRGSQVTCKICNWSGRKFPQGRCPLCKSFSRTRLIPYSFEFFNLKKNQDILHVAPNISEYLFVKNKINYKKYNTLNLTNLSFIDIVGDITNLDIKDNSYNLIIAWHLLEHINDDKRAISEMHRVLKNGGNLLLCVPIFPKENKKTFEVENADPSSFEEIYGHPDHVRGCGLDYYKKFERHGFKTKTLKVKEQDKSDIFYYGLSTSHIVWMFTK